jgi:hypothetical protein
LQTNADEYNGVVKKQLKETRTASL